jgi:Reverse transcriptase (RNA-dependent DNA polymerase)
VKTAFLHARLPHDIFVKQIPGFPEPDVKTVLHLLVALYGLKQSAYEWYKLLSTTLATLGLLRCEADHAVFIGCWTIPPDPSISMPISGTPLFLIIPIHVDDGLAVTNSLPLYQWFTSEISKTIELVCLGPVLNTRYLGQRIIRDRVNKTIRISQADLIVGLLEEWGLTNCKSTIVPLQHNPNSLPPCSPNACHDIPDDQITITYQCLVGSLTYLTICTRPDIAYTAMALGQFNASPTRTHLPCAKTVLQYLAGTVNLCLQFPSPSLPSEKSQDPLSTEIPPTCGLSDADWASDKKDRKSISGYCFFFLNSLVSWSSQKQRVVLLPQQSWNITRSPTLSKKQFGSAYFSHLQIYHPLHHSPFSATIKVLAPSLIQTPFPPEPNISMSIITSSANTLSTVFSLLLGFLPPA